MKKKVDGCIDCGLPCDGYCSYRYDTYEYYCDECGEEYTSDELYLYEDENKELCEKCLLKKFQKVSEI